MPNAQIDPELEYLLAHIDDHALVDVALLLRRESDPQAILARLDLAADPKVATSYLERVGVLSVRAPVAVIRRLIEQPEVELASAAASDE